MKQFLKWLWQVMSTPGGPVAFSEASLTLPPPTLPFDLGKPRFCAMEWSKYWEGLSEHQRKYAIQWFAASLDMVCDGFTEPHEDRDKALWARQEFIDAIREASVTQFTSDGENIED